MEYKTTDINLAAFLKAKYNFKLKALEPDPMEKDRALFVFLTDQDSLIEQFIFNYYNGDEQCSINEFVREVADLRSCLRNYKMNR